MLKLYPSTLLLAIITFGGTIACTVNKKTETQTATPEATNWDSVFTAQGLLNVKQADSTIQVHLRYSTENNFIGKDLYGSLEEAYLRPDAIEKLLKASRLLKEKHPELRLMIYDAARPRRIQQVLWDQSGLPEEERNLYVADPSSGSIHNYGCAVDLTVVSTGGQELDMGTDYDNFTPAAHIDREQYLIEQQTLTKEQVMNRMILRNVMVSGGFIPLTSEWWHFDAFPRSEVTERFTIVE